MTSFLRKSYALDASADDLLHDRTEDIGEFLKRMKAELRARKGINESGFVDA
jgi:hypothetical protein